MNYVKNKSNSAYLDEAVEIDKILSFTKKLFKNPNAHFGESDKTKNVTEVLVEGKGDFPFFNHKIIIFKKIDFENTTPSEVLYSNIDDVKKIDFKKYFHNNISNSSEIISEKELVILKSSIGKNKTLVFVERNYSSENLLFDILYLIFGIIIFSLLFYFIGKIFVEKVLQPVEENIEEMNNFIDNAGHELKTPLAAIQSSGALMKELKDFEPELIQEILDETKKSNKIISALRSLTKISKNSDSQIFTIQKVIKEIFISQKENAQKNNISLKFVNNNNTEITANKQYFYIMASNIISNAIKYNKQSGTVTAEIGERYIIISDSGIGIHKNNEKKIFERFYRLKNHSDIEGFGLGLSMVEKICKIYNWKISVESLEGIGTKIRIIF